MEIYIYRDLNFALSVTHTHTQAHSHNNLSRSAHHAESDVDPHDLQTVEGSTGMHVPQRMSHFTEDLLPPSGGSHFSSQLLVAHKSTLTHTGQKLSSPG